MKAEKKEKREVLKDMPINQIYVEKSQGGGIIGKQSSKHGLRKYLYKQGENHISHNVLWKCLEILFLS